MIMNSILQSCRSAEQVLYPAMEHYHAGRVGEAEAWYRAVLGDQPKRPEVNYHSGELLRQCGGAADTMLGHLKRALEVVSTQVQYWRCHVNALLLVGPTRAELNRHSAKAFPCT
jgi:hypothetical protein